MASPIRHLGIAFRGKKLSLAEIELSKSPQVLALDEGECAVDFSDPATNPEMHAEIGAVAGEIEALAQKNGVQAQAISFALPSSALFINSIPVDTSLKNDALTALLQWELQQYFPDMTPRTFVTDSHLFPVKSKDAVPTLLVAVRRGSVAFLQRVCAELKLKLHVVDVDHFSVEKTLLANYPEVKKETVALFGLYEGSLAASILHKRELVHYRHFRDASLENATTAGAYLKELRQTHEEMKPNAAYLYGTAVAPDGATSLRQHVGVQTTPLNVFRKLTAVPGVDKGLLKESYRFAAAIGVALRKE